MVAMMAVMDMNYLVSGTPPARAGNAHQNIVPYQVFACADGHLILAVGNDGQFAKFCAVAGRPEWARDPRFATERRSRAPPRHAGAAGRRRGPHARPARLARRRSSARACPAVRSTGSTRCSPTRRSSRAGSARDLPHPLAGTVPQVVAPLRFSATPLAYDAPPPLLGEHTAAVLREALGYDDAAIAALAARGVIGLVAAD